METDITPVVPLAAEPASSVGRVQGLLDSTPLLWHVAVQEGAYLQLDDIVVTVRDVPGRGPVTTSGIITEVRARHEGASFGSDVFLISDGVLPAADGPQRHAAGAAGDPDWPLGSSGVQQGTAGAERDSAHHAAFRA